MKILRLVSIWAGLSVIVATYHMIYFGHLRELYEPIGTILCVGIYLIGFGPTGASKASLQIRQRQNRICAGAFLGLALPLYIAHAVSHMDSREAIEIHIRGFLMNLPICVLAYLAMDFWFLIEDRISASKKQPANQES